MREQFFVNNYSSKQMDLDGLVGFSFSSTIVAHLMPNPPDIEVVLNIAI